MAFVVEDGSGVSNANAYVSVAFVDAYQADRGDTVWAAASNTQKEQAIVRATDYIDSRFGIKFRGFKQSKAQALEWPRLSAFDNDDFLLSGPEDAVPRQLQRGCAEYAWIALQLDPLLPIPGRPFSVLDPATGQVTSQPSGQVQRKRSEVGPVEEETWYESTANLLTRKKPGASSSTVVTDFNLPEYPRADQWLQELLKADFSAEMRRGN